jgi:DNA/RNA endonuclease YhcR with UshA esterase domain
VFVTNAQGQVTSVTNTAIAINGSAVTGNITGQAGSVANALTAGTFLTSGGTYNGSAARTFAVDATDANTASKVVARDASGNFAAGTITAALSGNATSATNVAGGAANRIVFNTNTGTTSFVVAPTASGQVLNWNGSAFTYVAGTISGITLGSNLNALTAGTYLTSAGTYDGSTARTFAVDATTTNTASKVVARDASGNFSAGTITAALSGNATTATSAATWTTARTLTVGATGKSVNGSADVSWTVAEVVGFTPVQQGGGTGQGANKLYMGWTGSALALQVDSTNFASTWPISVTGNAVTATTATNIAGGAAGRIPYNTGAGTTAFVAAGTAGQILQSNGTSAPTFVNNTAAARGYVQAMNIVFGL